MNIQLHLSIAKKAAETASKILRQGFNKEVRITNNKSGVVANIVTEYDFLAQTAILKIIKKQFPTHNILAEEGINEQNNSDFEWIIDPLDGTTNFSRKIPNFSTSIGLAYKGKLIVGVIGLPFQKEIYYASHGKGAFMNGKKIRVSETNKLSKAVIGISMDRSEEALDVGTKTFINLTHAPSKPRVFGSVAADLARVASGSLDAIVFNHMHPWDFAAGVVLVREAGGKVSKVEKGEFNLEGTHYVASNSKLHQALLDTLRK